MLVVWTQIAYLVLSVGMTVYVAQSLHKQGRIFLLRTFVDDDVMADSVNHLLLVGFYLINIGWVILWTTYGDRPFELEGSIVFVTTKFGKVMLILGCMHFFNLWLLWKIRKAPANPDPAPEAGPQADSHVYE